MSYEDSYSAQSSLVTAQASWLGVPSQSLGTNGQRSTGQRSRVRAPSSIPFIPNDLGENGNNSDNPQSDPQITVLSDFQVLRCLKRRLALPAFHPGRLGYTGSRWCGSLCASTCPVRSLDRSSLCSPASQQHRKHASEISRQRRWTRPVNLQFGEQCSQKLASRNSYAALNSAIIQMRFKPERRMTISEIEVT